MTSTKIFQSLLCIIPRHPPRFHAEIIMNPNTMNLRQYSQSSSHSKFTELKKLSQSEAGRIHILGTGNIGLFFAHSLAKELNPPPITLLLHRSKLLDDWNKNGRKIQLVRGDSIDIASGFDVELLNADDAGSQSIIANLIIATKAPKTVEAVSSVAHRLNSESTVLFTQNGMGVISKVNTKIFPKASQRPCYLAAVNTHGVKSTPGKLFQPIHAGIGNVTIGPDPDSSMSDVKSKDWRGRYLLDKIVQAENLVATEVDAQELLRLQLEKLIVNSIINPLTTVLGCENGALFRTDELKDLIKILVEEAVEVINELPGGQVEGRLEPERMIELVSQIGILTSSNTSSMLQDSRAGRPTEIDFINGWIVEKGKEMDKGVKNHEMLMKLVKDGGRTLFNRP